MKQQRGMATIFIILAIGVAVSVSTIGVLHHLKSTQLRQHASHATVSSQSSTWQGAEIVRRYLMQVDQEVLEQWSQSSSSIPITIGNSAKHTAVIDQVTKTGVVHDDASASNIHQYTVVAEIAGTSYAGGSSQASSVLEVVYLVGAQLAQETAPETPTNPPVMNSGINVFNIRRDLNMTGAIRVIGGQSANFNVEGNVVLDSASIDGINSINSTGNVSIGSGIRVNNVHSNGDIRLTGSASIAQIRNRGNVTISGGTSSLSIQSNGLVTFQGGQAASVDSKGGVRVTAGGVNVSSIRTEGAVEWTGTGGGASVIESNQNVVYAGNNRNPTMISSKNDVQLTGGGATKVVATRNIMHQSYGNVNETHNGGNVTVSSSGSIARVFTKGNASLTSSGTINNILGQGNIHVGAYQAVSGTVRGDVTKTQMWNTSVNVSRNPNLIVDVETPVTVSLAEVPEVGLPKNEPVNVYALRSSANYIFEYINNQITVTVNGVSGIPSGPYRLGNKVVGGNQFPQWLCKASDMSGNTCTNPVANICEGFSDYNACFTYSGGKWTVNGKSMARGVVWFDGNLEVGNGHYVNTWLATGNINTAGGHKTTSPNYAGFAVTCQNQPPRNSSLGVNQNFRTLVPTNLCDNTSMVSNPIANSAFIGGGYNPTTGAYGGGVIQLGASTLAEGNVVGADVVNTGGSTTIKGSVVANAQNTSNRQPMSFSGSTTIDLTGGSENFTPGVVPCMSNCTPPPPPPAQEHQLNTSSVHWVRYR